MSNQRFKSIDQNSTQPKYINPFNDSRYTPNSLNSDLCKAWREETKVREEELSRLK